MFQSILPLATLTLSHSDWVLLNYTPERALGSCLEQTSSLWLPPQTGPQDWGPLGKALLSPPGSSSRKTCTIIQWSVGLKSQSGSLPSPPPFQAPDGDTSCTASTFYGSLRCPKGPPNSWRLSGEEAEVRLLPISGAFPSQICHLLPLIIILSCLV